MIAKAIRRMTQPTHDTNRRALMVLAGVLLLAVVYLAVSHHMFGLLGSKSPAAAAGPPAAAASPAATHPAAPAAGSTAGKAAAPAGPVPNYSRNPFQGP
jgi:zona occludens toxin (predicted ATPase)